MSVVARNTQYLCFALAVSCLGICPTSHAQGEQPKDTPVAELATIPDATLDTELIRAAQTEKLNLFFDATDTPEGKTSVIRPDEQQTFDLTKKLGSSNELSSLEFRPKTLLFWSRPDVLALAHGIVKGQGIQILEVPKDVQAAAILPPPATPKGKKATSQELQRDRTYRDGLTTQEPLLFSVLKEVEEMVGKLSQRVDTLENKEAGAAKPKVVATRLKLSLLNENNRLITGAYAQYYVLRLASGAAKDAWMTDAYWKGVNLVLQEMPNQVVRRSELNQPRKTIPVLSVSGNIGLGGKSVFGSKRALAVLPTPQ